MDIRIGIQHVARELSLEVDDADADTVKADVEAALSGGSAVLSITDRDGRRVAVSAAQLAYVEFGSTSSRTIGFGS